MIAAGLMSGTSLDGIDAVCLQIAPRGESYRFEVLDFATFRWGERLHRALLDALAPNPGTIAGVAELHAQVGRAFGAAARAIAGERPLDFVASHGQTIFHRGESGVTMQIGDAFSIRLAAQATVCYDFRSADCAAGGHGAPLVPYFDMLALRDRMEDRIALNIGGVANLTILPKGAPRDAGVIAFDTGPGNLLLDALVRARTHNAMHMDRDGQLASRGTINAALLTQLMNDDYFALAAPKTTGRERFGSGFLRIHTQALESLNTADAAATLTELTVESIALAIEGSALPGARILVSGGGARNAFLMQRLAARLPACVVETTEAMGIPVDAKEAIAFAMLGYETLRGRAANVPAATGARELAVLGAIAPHDLPALLERLDRECRASW